jgi:hypothetical protein
MADSIGDMANELLDFVMSLVRDPDAAARYAENPQQAIADAHLADVTSVDVNNLIPVVSESLSMAAPAFGADAVGDANVWASGAATAAFDAFSDHQPAPAVVDSHQPVIHEPAAPLDPGVEQFADPGPDLHTVDAGMLDQPLVTPDVHDFGPAVDTGVDPGFDDPGPEHHSFDHHIF